MCAFSTNFPCCACHSGLATVAWSKLVWRARVSVLCFSALWRGNSLVMCVLPLTLPLYLRSGHCTYSRLIFKLQNIFCGAQNARPTAPWHLFFWHCTYLHFIFDYMPVHSHIMWTAAWLQMQQQRPIAGCFSAFWMGSAGRSLRPVWLCSKVICGDIILLLLF